MTRRGFVALVCVLVAGISFITVACHEGDTQTLPAGQTAFPDAHELPLANWTGPVFKLRQDYPAAAPAKEALPWDNIDPRTDGVAYAKAVLAYIYDGNTAVDFEIEKNKVRNW